MDLTAGCTANFSLMKPESPFSAESFFIHKLLDSTEDGEEPEDEMDGHKLLAMCFKLT